MANIKHYYPCAGDCKMTWAMAHMVVVGANQYCKYCAPEARLALDKIMGNPMEALARLTIVSGR